STASTRAAEFVQPELANELSSALSRLAAQGASRLLTASILRILAAERAETQAVADRYELVWSGDETASETRCTSVVVEQLFAEAQESILVASYVIERTERAAAILGSLARRIDVEPSFRVQLFINIDRQFSDTRPAAEIVHDWMET